MISIVYGRILLAADYEQAIKVLQDLGEDDYYPFMGSDAFHLGSLEPYRYYDAPVISFSATYKSVDYEWAAFIVKFEHILRRLKFDTVKLHLETEMVGDYHFFWRSKLYKTSYDKEDEMIETDEWFFGYGQRSMWGTLEEDLQPYHIFKSDFSYPVKLDETLWPPVTALLNDANSLPLGTEIVLENFMPYPLWTSPAVFSLIVSLKSRDYIDYSFVPGKAYVLHFKKRLEPTIDFVSAPL